MMLRVLGKQVVSNTFQCLSTPRLPNWPCSSYKTSSLCFPLRKRHAGEISSQARSWPARHDEPEHAATTRPLSLPADPRVGLLSRLGSLTASISPYPTHELVAALPDSKTPRFLLKSSIHPCTSNCVRHEINTHEVTSLNKAFLHFRMVCPLKTMRVKTH
ncbi:hypothetical protein JR316_0011751 [Psilocybe cubensis]|uniref:Uncharacterized protein n=4 Tax=Psilocybe cubensis TaxID=181762 RepID=A0A8H7XUT2_PSICU|nr:hypothetical protein JR316_0011347 [Psilocybe cubensis]XP_047743770.1 hypothetical protein JR316_0011716 [Psilocybe cubensis]XP_047743805.1 hypothetical protein JR316_0011751 [Psilocybe cubensis]KAH9475788.1 hypothetical protein JR316_0011347 [Psilocybe cubensis]KAH9476145.1 hypothetical protein JR316_0011716 [Psilocybe cubensis]KAH9476180.1 hypothetical protein JR316_0011751 [Psilocybe cubensis]